MRTKEIIWGALAILGLLGGWYGKTYLAPEATTPEAQQKEAGPPALSSDSFSLRLFHQALAEKESGNVLVAPHIVSDTLLALQEIAGGQTREELSAMQLAAVSPPRGTEPERAILLAADINLQRTGCAVRVMPLPFSENVPMALSLFNGSLASAMLNPNAQLADSKNVTSRTRLLAGCTTTMREAWEIPFNSANSRTADFDSDSGGMPHFQQMRSRGLYRSATAEDESWKAVALPFRKNNTSGEQLFFIGILPAGNARNFATALTPDTLTTIRRNLAEAEPQDSLVELPRTELHILPFDMRDTLRRMGLKALFDSEMADFSSLTPEEIHLGGLLFSASVHLTESEAPPQADASLHSARETFSFSRPYIWLVADLHSPTPPEFIGLQVEM